MHNRGNFGFIYSSFFRNETEGYVGGGCYFTFPECPGYTVHKTVDSGENWERVESALTFTGTGNIVALSEVAQDELLLLQEYGGLFKLNLTNSTVDSLTIDIQSEANHFLNLEVFNDQRWLVSFYFHQIDNQSYHKFFYTENSGSTWNELFDGNHNGDYFLDVKYLDRNTWIAASNNGKVYLVNNKTRAEIFHPSNSINERVVSLEITSGKGIYALSQDESYSAIYRSDNQGLDWELEFETNEYQLSQMNFSNSEEGYAFAPHISKLVKRTPKLFDPVVPLLDLEVFPNPTNREFCITEFQGAELIHAEIYDSSGKLTGKKLMKFGLLNIRELPQGTYIAQFFDQSSALLGQAKFVKI